jgi:branched-chain amino acid transport system permease protein
MVSMVAQIINGLVLASIYVLFALAITLAWGMLDILNLSHGSIAMFGAFAAFLVSQHSSLPLAALIAISAATGGVIALLLDQIVFRVIRQRASSRAERELLTLIAGIGAGAILLTYAQERTLSNPFGIARLQPTIYSVGSLKISNYAIVIVVVGFGLAILMGVWVRRSRWGRALRALAFDRETCAMMGVNPSAVTGVTMFISGVLGGLTGILLMMYLSAIDPDTGNNLLLKGFAIVILGGVGSIWGTLAAGIILAAGETIVVVTTNGNWTDAVAFAIVMIVIIIRPQGLFAQRKSVRAQ